jgi:aminoglycoside phosphotransferase (APT) family kinase protein
MTSEADAVAAQPLDFIEARRDQLGPQLGRGQGSEVFGWGNAQVCKLFSDEYAEEAEKEYAASRVAHSAGLPVPMVLGAIRIEGRIGLIFERVDGSDLDTLSRTRWGRRTDYARTIAELHHRMHQIPAPETLVPQNEMLTSWLNRVETLPTEAKHRAIEAMGELPAGRQLCHGDFHFGNVMQTPSGPSIIDWATGNSGSPLADVAATEVLMLVPIVSAALFPVASWVGRWRARVYMSRYREISDFDEQEYAERFRIALAARLSNVSFDARATRKLLGMLDQSFSV